VPWAHCAALFKLFASIDGSLSEAANPPSALPFSWMTPSSEDSNDMSSNKEDEKDEQLFAVNTI